MVLKPIHGDSAAGNQDARQLAGRPHRAGQSLAQEAAKKNVDLTSWADEKLEKQVLLKDSNQPDKGNTFLLLGQVLKSGESMKEITEKRIQVYLIFEMPTRFPPKMYVVLPGAAFHVDGTVIGYEFSKSDVGS